LYRNNEGQNEEESAALRGDEWLSVHLHVLEGELALIQENPEEATIQFEEAKEKAMRLLSSLNLMVSPWLPSDKSAPLVCDESEEENHKSHPLFAQIASHQGM